MRGIIKKIGAGVILASAVGMLCTATTMLSAADEVVYVADNGNDAYSGDSAKFPKKTIGAAYASLKDKGGVIVVCGPLTLSGQAGTELPECGHTVRITSSYNGESFTGARLILKDDLYINGDTLIEDINIASVPGNMIYCCGHNVTFGQGINVTLTSAGSYPYIFGGTYCSKSGMKVQDCTFDNYTVRVDSGTWSAVRGGNYRDNGNNPTGFIGNVSVIVNGGRFVGGGNSSSDLAVISATSFCGLDGDAYLEINGGTFNCSIFGIGRPGSNSKYNSILASFEGDLRINITGGVFSGKNIAAMQNTMSLELDGDYDLVISGGTFSHVPSLDAEGVGGRAHASVKDDALHARLSGFASPIYVASHGSDSNSGGPESPVQSLAAAIGKADRERGAYITVLDRAVLDSFVCTDKIDSGVYVCGAEGAELEMIGNNSINSELYIDNLKITARDATLSSMGNSITAGEGIEVFGVLDLDCGKGDGSRSLTVCSGSYRSLCAGSSSEGDTCVVVCGGKADLVLGSGGERTGGDASVILLGGEAGRIVASDAGCKGNAGVAVYGGRAGSVSSVSSGRISGDFGVILTPGNESTAVFAVNVIGNKLWADYGVTAPEGYINAGRAYFFSDNASSSDDSGSTPASPGNDVYRILSDAKADYKGDVSVVILDRLTVAGDLSIPSTGGKSTVGGSFCGINWRTAFGCRLNIGGVVTLNSDTVIDNIEIISCTNSAYIAGNCNELVIGADVECSCNFAKGINKHPSLCGGIVATGSGYGGTRSCVLTVNSGDWHYVYGGNIILSSSDSARRHINGNITVTVNGGAFHGGVSASGMNDMSGNASLVVNGGEFRCSIYAMPRANDSVGRTIKIRGDVSITLNRGEFCGDILAAQRNEDIDFDGTYTLTMGGGDYRRVGTIRSAEGIGTGGGSVLNIADNIDLDAQIEGAVELENPIAGFADPSVYYYDGWYYYTYSKDYAGKPGLWLSRAANIADLGKTEPVMIWSAAKTGSDIKSLWAPQIYYLDGRWYIYATCSSDSSSEAARRYHYVWVGEGQSPTDSYVLHGRIDNYDTSVQSYLSPRIIERDGHRYVVCGGFFRAEDKVAGVRHYQRLFIGELETPTRYKTGMTVIAEPTMKWEGTGKVRILEGPFPLYAPGGTLYIAYSAGETSGNEYCTGLLKFVGGEGDLLTDRTKWQKLPEPLQFMDYENEVYSPGAMVFVTEADGAGLWGIFHAKFYPNVGYNHRILYAMPITFEGDMPVMGSPEHTHVTYPMDLNPLPIRDRIVGGFSYNTVPPSPDPFPEVINPADTDPADTDIGTGAPTDKAHPKNGTGLLLPLIVGGLALAGAALLLILRKKKK